MQRGAGPVGSTGRLGCRRLRGTKSFPPRLHACLLPSARFPALCWQRPEDCTVVRSRLSARFTWPAQPERGGQKHKSIAKYSKGGAGELQDLPSMSIASTHLSPSWLWSRSFQSVGGAHSGGQRRGGGVWGASEQRRGTPKPLPAAGCPAPMEYPAAHRPGRPSSTPSSAAAGRSPLRPSPSAAHRGEQAEGPGLSKQLEHASGTARPALPEAGLMWSPAAGCPAACAWGPTSLRLQPPSWSPVSHHRPPGRAAFSPRPSPPPPPTPCCGCTPNPSPVPAPPTLPLSPSSASSWSGWSSSSVS